MSFHALEQQSNLHDGYQRAFVINGVSVLLIQHAGRVYAVENKCGHFGVPLENGRVGNQRIRCTQHGAEFELATGKVTNNVVANCDPLRVFNTRINGNSVEIEL